MIRLRFNGMRGAYSTSATPTKFHGGGFTLISLQVRAGSFDLYGSFWVQPTGSNEQERRHGLVILKTSSRQCGQWRALLVVALFVASTPAAHARAHHSDAWAREHFATAERMREALNGRPPADRTRRDYQRVLNAYRSVYLGAPACPKADPSVVAVAETLVEMGRRFDDDKILNEAIEQYKFLRREYPGSRYRFDGLFTIGEIYKDDLSDSEAARATFQEFLRRYPHNRLADDARQAIVELNQKAQAEKAAEARKAAEKKQAGKSGNNNKNVRIAGDDHTSRGQSSSPQSSSEQSSGARAGKDESPEARIERLPRVTGIRHWSAPDYSRVAIDLEGNVKFVSRRIDSPARIFFDLPDTKLASTLVGKSFDVDDGFLTKVRVAQFAPDSTRIVLEVDNLSDYDAFLLPNPYRLVIDIHGKDGRTKQLRDRDKEAGGSTAEAGDGGFSPKAIGTGFSSDATASVSANGVASKLPPPVVKKIVEADDDTSASSAEVARRNAAAAKRGSSPTRNAVVAKKQAGEDVEGETEALSIREAKPTAGGDRSLIRALGLKIGKIVIDPGHGGHDTGTIGPNGLEEKELVLDVGRRLGKLLEARLGAEVVYTRKNDTFIPLETRTAIANQARADLFVSIHANSSRDPGARGVETYYLNFTSSPEALEVAARENAVSEKSIYELRDLVKKIALKEKIEESREFAGDVQESLHGGLAAKTPAIRDRGVKKAPFIVLIGANMPSILAEVSFVSNPVDEHRLSTSEYRQRIAESLYRGIAKYANGLSGVKVASKMDKGAVR
jgi:N-acetylmuramoyl-L-alanine amidase